MNDWLEEFWGDLLSEEPLRIAAAWATLDGEEREAVYAHLIEMTIGLGWAEVQRQGARIALQVLRDTPPSESSSESSHST